MKNDWPQFCGVGQLVKMSESDVGSSKMLSVANVFQKNLTVISSVQNQNPGLNPKEVKRFLRLDPIVDMRKRESGKIKIQRR